MLKIICPQENKGDKMRQKILIIMLTLTAFSIYGQTESILESGRIYDYSRVFNNEVTLKISHQGELIFGDFKFRIYSFPEQEVINDYKDFETLVYGEFLFVDIVLDSSSGGHRFSLFANYKTNNIIFYKNIYDLPSGLMKVIGIKDKIVFIFSGGVSCFDIKSSSFIWDNIWNEYLYNDNFDYNSSIKDFTVKEEFIYLFLENNKMLEIDYESGEIK